VPAPLPLLLLVVLLALLPVVVLALLVAEALVLAAAAVAAAAFWLASALWLLTSTCCVTCSIGCCKDVCMLQALRYTVAMQLDAQLVWSHNIDIAGTTLHITTWLTNISKTAQPCGVLQCMIIPDAVH
jgi:hypothetical protein